MNRQTALRPTLLSSCLAFALGGLAWLATPPAEPLPYVMLLAAGKTAEMQKLLDGAQAAARRYHVDLSVRVSDDGDAPGQSDLLARTEEVKPDAVIICPVDPHGQSEEIGKLVPLTHVVTCGDDAPESNRRLYVGRGDFATGQVGGRLVRSLLPSGGEVAIVWNQCHASHKSRREGLENALARPASAGEEAPWRMPAQIDDRGAAACRRRIEQALFDHPNLACLVCFGSRHCKVAVRVLAEHDARDVKFIVLEPNDATLDLLAQGRVDAVVTVDPYRIGYAAVARTAALCRSTPMQYPVPGLGAVHIQPEVVTRDTLAAFRGRSSVDVLAAFN